MVFMKPEPTDAAGLAAIQGGEPPPNQVQVVSRGIAASANVTGSANRLTANDKGAILDRILASMGLNPADPLYQSQFELMDSPEQGGPAYLGNLSRPRATGAELFQLLQNYPEEKLEEYQSRLFRAGYYGSTKPEHVRWGVLDKKTIAAFNDFLGDASISSRGLSIESFLDEQAQNFGKGGPAGSDDGPSTTTQRYVTEINKDGARSALSNMIGRSVSDDEVRRFMDDYNSNARTMATTQTTTSDGEGNFTQTTTGGFDPETQMRKLAAKNEDFANYQAATTYYNAIMSALDQGMSPQLEGDIS